MFRPQSWVQSANDSSTPFPLSNLPYGVFSTAKLSPRCGVAIGDQVLDIRSCEAAGLIELSPQLVFDRPHWNKLMALDRGHWQRFRAIITDLLRTGSEHQQYLQARLTPLSQVNLHMPFQVRGFTDLCTAGYYPTDFFDLDNYLPTASRHSDHASTVVVSGTPIRRPNGFKSANQAEFADFGPSARLDVACEMGAVIGGSLNTGQSLTNKQADAMIFGYVLLVNWSEPKTKAWIKNQILPSSCVKPFATSISPWVVSAAALEPFRLAASDLERSSESMLHDMDIVVELQAENDLASTLADINYHDICYSPAQQLSRYVSSGHIIGGGDLIGLNSIFISERKRRAKLLELAWSSREPLDLYDDDTSYFIEDGDTLSIAGKVLNSELQIGFGNCYNKILPAARSPRLAYKPSVVYYRYG